MDGGCWWGRNSSFNFCGNRWFFFKWSLSGADANQFLIDEDSGILRFDAKGFDGDTPSNNVFGINLIASDTSGNITIQALQVTVIDAVNPIFTGFGVAPVTPLIEVDAGSTVPWFASTDQSSVTFSVDDTYEDGDKFDFFDGDTLKFLNEAGDAFANAPAFTSTDADSLMSRLLRLMQKAMKQRRYLRLISKIYQHQQLFAPEELIR